MPPANPKTQNKIVKTVKCPTCSKLAVWSSSNPSRPFCSERCKLIDLGAWANEEHKIPGAPISPEKPEGEFNEDDFWQE